MTNNSNLTTGIPGGALPEWAHHSRRCDDGRTRHTVESAPYMLPNDLTESDRLDAQHYLVRFIFKGNYNVKLDPEANLKILDVATGTGVWALEMAHEFPKADIYGVDISSIFPAEIKPKNCHFQLCNILDGLPFPDNYFDFIYQRLLVYALTPAQRKQVNTEVCLSVCAVSAHCPLSSVFIHHPSTSLSRSLFFLAYVLCHVAQSVKKQAACFLPLCRRIGALQIWA